MIRFLTDTFHRLLEATVTTHRRYLYPQFSLKTRLVGLVGPRGVGKTTLMLQYIKNELSNHTKAFYFSADSIYFQQSSLLKFVEELHLKEGYQIVFIDEIHKYQGWNQELKNMYDSFPQLKIVFSGSSMLDIVTGSYDLSRRAKLYKLHGLSFREYLNFNVGMSYPTFSLDEIVEAPSQVLSQLKECEKILPHFESYLQNGYYPFFLEDLESYFEKLTQVIDKTIFEDIVNCYNLKTPNLQYFKKLLSYLASIPSGELNPHNLSKHIQIDQKTVEHYLSILAAVGLVREMKPFEGGGLGLRKHGKIFLNNTNLVHTLNRYLGQPAVKGTIRELFFIQSLQNQGIELFYSKQGDYRTRDIVFEIGGKNKTRDQLKRVVEPSYLVKDDIFHPLKGEIPLFLFGFLY